MKTIGSPDPSGGARPNPRPGRSKLSCSAPSSNPYTRRRRPTTSTRSKHPRPTLPTHRCAQAVAHGARTGVRSTPTPTAATTASNAPVQLAVPITDQQPEPADLVPKPHAELPGLLGSPLPHWMHGHPQDMHPPDRHLDHQQHAETSQQHAVHGEEVHCQHPLGLSAQEVPPRHGRPLGCWSNAGVLQAGPHATRPDPVPKPAQLAMHSARAPGRVLPDQPRHPGHTARPPRPHGHAGVGRSSGAGPGRDASPAAWPAARTTGAGLDGAAAAPARPAPPGLPGPPGPSAAGSPGVAAPRPPAAASADRRSWLPYLVPAARASPAAGRTCGRAVAWSGADHRGRWLPRRTRSSARGVRKCVHAAQSTPRGECRASHLHAPPSTEDAAAHNRHPAIPEALRPVAPLPRRLPTTACPLAGALPMRVDAPEPPMG
jgi:hypothetical protein